MESFKSKLSQLSPREKEDRIAAGIVVLLFGGLIGYTINTTTDVKEEVLASTSTMNPSITKQVLSEDNKYNLDIKETMSDHELSIADHSLSKSSKKEIERDTYESSFETTAISDLYQNDDFITDEDFIIDAVAEESIEDRDQYDVNDVYNATPDLHSKKDQIAVVASSAVQTITAKITEPKIEVAAVKVEVEEELVSEEKEIVTPNEEVSIQDKIEKVSTVVATTKDSVVTSIKNTTEQVVAEVKEVTQVATSVQNTNQPHQLIQVPENQVIIGAFRSLENCKKRQNLAHKNGYNTYIKHNTASLYLLGIETSSDRQEQLKLQQKVDRLFGITSWVKTFKKSK